jgi:hypothetical protein
MLLQKSQYLGLFGGIMKKNYSPSMFINYQNQKTLGSEIQNIDTIRGCPYSCESCYAERLSKISIEDFKTAVPIEKLVGKVDPNKLYRIGNSGDPCVNWEHSEKIIKEKMILNNFVVTKLQTLKGYTGFFHRLQVSIDTLNKAHFDKTVGNIYKLVRDFTEAQVVMRIRSLNSNDPSVMKRQEEAVQLANQLNLPILDTRIRFQRKASIEKHNLVADDYEWRGSWLRPKHGRIFLSDVDRYYDCDLFGNHCESCRNCDLPFENKKEGKFISDLMGKEKKKYKKLLMLDPTPAVTNFDKLAG